MQAQINGISMRYEVSGPDNAPAVVLHHPLATDLGVWDELTAALAGDYRVIRFDARGHGASEAPKAPPPYGFSTLCRDVTALMDHAGADKAAFIGVSMGGMIGQHLAVEQGDRFYGFMLVSTTSRIPAEAQPLWRDRVVVAREQGMRSQVETALPRWLAKASFADAALVARLSRMIEATPVEGYAGWCQTIGGLDITERLAAVRCPVTVVVGADDPSTPPAAAQVIAEAIPGANLIVMPGVSHQCMVEQPEAFRIHARAFLDINAGA